MDRSQQLFDDRYGPGALRRLTTMLEQPCATFAAIADQFGVSRERVRQWHIKFCPGAPRGHQRQRLCALQRSKRDMLRQPLFRTFYRHARAHFEPRRFELIACRDGFLGRSVRLDGYVVAIRAASVKHRGGAVSTYALRGGAPTVDFLYFRVSEEEFLFVPRSAIPPTGVSYRPGVTWVLEPFRNTFAAALSRKDFDRQAS
jgi:hypothetical protein